MNDFKSLLTLQEVSVRVQTPHRISSEVLECCYYAVIRDTEVGFVNRMFFNMDFDFRRVKILHSNQLLHCSKGEMISKVENAHFIKRKLA